jgi:WASH complex subunit 7
MEEAWEEENSARRMLAEQLQKGLLFVQDHEKSFKELDEQTRPHPTLGVPQLNHFPICMAMEPPERVFPLDLMMSDNTSVNKVLTVLVYLCDEINELKEMAETKFYGTLVVFGQRPCEKSPDEDLLDNPFQSGEKERMVGKMLITLQELSNFIDRCYFVAVNLVQQLSALLNAKEPLYRVIFQKCKIFPAFSSLADLLGILITLDSIIEQNEYIVGAWSEYKVLMTFAKADPKAYGVDPSHFALFEKLLLSIDQGLLVGEIFKACIEQDFQFVQGVDGHPDMQVNVRNNSLFLENFKSVITYFMQSALTVVGTSMEVFERTQIVGYYGLYALYRQLQPANVQPDLKWHMSLFWETQKRVPWIIMCNQKVSFFM